MQLVETITVGSGGAASIEFTSIPQDADDLLLVASLRNSSAQTAMVHYLRINNATTTYSSRLLQGDGSSATSASSNLQFAVNGTTTTSNTFTNTSFYLPNYSGSTSKSVSVDNVLENNATDSRQQLFAALRTETAAVTSLKIEPGAGTILEFSSASLYKIVKA